MKKIVQTLIDLDHGTVVYLASLTTFDPALYAAAIVDGVNCRQQTVLRDRAPQHDPGTRAWSLGA